ncbi:MAG: GH92 family glycosyl hydrolase, partial [Bacteroidota bacterium]
MKNTTITYYLIITLFFIYACNTIHENDKSKQVIEYVDPMIGTDAHGHTFPGATVPFGMLQLSPSNDFKNWDWCSGYHYSDSVLKGFAHNHISGPGLSGLGDILLMPTSELHLTPGTEKNPETGYRSRFSHDNESASPGYYKVFLDDANVLVELTTSKRVGYHRYTFDEVGEKFITIDPTHGIADFAYETGINIISATEIIGYKKSKSGTAGDRTVYFYVVFSKPFKNAGIGKKDEIQKGIKNLSGADVRGFACFDMANGEAIEVEVALSYVSQKGAKSNWEAEGEAFDFDLAKNAAEAQWKEKLDKIVISTKSEPRKKTFYTAMYHSFISPNLISDVDGKYFLEGEVKESSIPQYSNFSTWDTYRALHPLLTIVEQEKTAEIVNSMISRYTEAGLILPGWEAIGYDNVCMIGYNMTSPIADAVLKDVPGINAEEAYAAIKAAAFDKTKHSQNYDQNGMDGYIKYGYVTGEIGSSVSKTTEQNYYDWAIGKVAEKLGKKEDATLFNQRSKAWRNLFHKGTGYLFPKLSTGELVELKTNTWNGLRSNYVSGNIWAYSAYTPHDMAAAIQLQGGREAYTKWLDGIFNDSTELEGHQHVDISGFIGKYGHGDEPGHQMPYLFNMAGKPWLTQKYVSEVVNTMYSDKPDGLINNEDLGQMSAWYIFSTLGFYPIAPGNLTYQFGAPLYDEAVISLENGSQFKIVARNQSAENIYVQKVWLNGNEYDKTYIKHADILLGGTLEFEMGAEPNKLWGIAPESSSLGIFNDQEEP